MDEARRAGAVVSRRTLLGGAAALTGAAVVLGAPWVRAADAAAPYPDGYPFALGVASGDPTPDGVVLWTRLAPAPLEADGGLDPQPIDVRWELARDEGMRDVVRRGGAVAWPAFAHSVHVEVTGLEPGREWYYRFTAGDAVSPVGRTRTAPRRGAAVDGLSFAFVSCQNWEDGFFPVLRDIAELDVDFVFHLGDYIYEYGIQNGKGPRAPDLPAEFAVETTTLEHYRLRHALYKTDPQLRAAHAAHPFVVTWDDHEVENDYAGLARVGGEDPTGFPERRRAAYQAYYEHLPLRAASIPDDAETRIYRRLRWGDLASFSVLDTRQYRTDQPCGDGESERCAAALDPSQTLTGPEQERWLLRGLSTSDAQWNVIAQQVLMAELDHELAPDAKRFWNDAWDGYPAARARILQHLHSREVPNPVVLTGDWHSTFANDVKLDFDDPASPTVASEFVTPSITTGGDRTPYGPYYGPMVPFNPHIRFFDGDRRGSLVARLSRERMEVDWRVAARVATPDAPVWPLRRFTVEAGRPGVLV